MGSSISMKVLLRATEVEKGVVLFRETGVRILSRSLYDRLRQGRECCVVKREFGFYEGGSIKD